MHLRTLRLLARELQQVGWNQNTVYHTLRKEVVRRIAGKQQDHIFSLFQMLSDPSIAPLPEKAQAILENLPVRPEGSSEGLTPQSLSLLDEFFSSNAKKNGIFYTPWIIAVHLARQTLYQFLRRRLEWDQPTADQFLSDSSFSLPKATARQADDLLSQLTVCDPAAGAGGLLVPFALELASLRRRLNPTLSAQQALYFAIRHNLYATDISATALENLQLRLALLLLAYGLVVKTPEVLPHTFCGDSLSAINGKSIWKVQFPELFSKNGGFDIILCNPPYLGQKNHRSVFDSLRKNPLWKNLFQPKNDLLYFFFYLAIDLLKEGGVGSFLTTAYFASAAGAMTLRKELKTHTALLQLDDWGEKRLFKRAVGQHNLISIFEKNHACQKPACTIGTQSVLQDQLYQGDGLFLQTRLTEKTPLQTALFKMASCSLTLQKVASVTNGLMTGCDKVSASHLRKHPIDGIQKDVGVFVLTEAEKNALPLTETEKQKLKPFFKNSDIFPYTVHTTPSYWLVDFFYPNDRDLDFSRYPNLRAHLSRFAPILLARKQNNNGINKLLDQGIYWFGSVRRKMDFEADKIAVPQRSKRNIFAFAPGPWYASSDVYFISHPKEGFSLWYLLGLFNSAPYFAWLSYYGKRKGHLLELYSAPLKALPVPIPAEKDRHQLATLAQQIYRLKSANAQADVSALQQQADSLVGRFFEFTPDQQKAIQSFDGDFKLR